MIVRWNLLASNNWIFSVFWCSDAVEFLFCCYFQKLRECNADTVTLDNGCVSYLKLVPYCKLHFSPNFRLFHIFTGQALVNFRISVLGSDGVLKQWRPEDSDPCGWKGVLCDPKSKRVISLWVSVFLLKHLCRWWHCCGSSYFSIFTYYFGLHNSEIEIFWYKITLNKCWEPSVVGKVISGSN